MRKKKREAMYKAQQQGLWSYAKWFYKDMWGSTLKVAGAAALGKLAYDHRDELAEMAGQAADILKDKAGELPIDVPFSANDSSETRPADSDGSTTEPTGKEE